jgi:hypothetical protein
MINFNDYFKWIRTEHVTRKSDSLSIVLILCHQYFMFYSKTFLMVKTF